MLQLLQKLVLFMFVVALRVAHGACVLLGIIGGVQFAHDGDSYSYAFFFMAVLAGMPWRVLQALLPDEIPLEVLKIAGYRMAAGVNGWLLYHHRLLDRTEKQAA